MDVTLLGMLIDVNPLQRSKANEPMLVTLLGSVIVFKPLQPSKADEPMLVTLLGMVVFLHPKTSVLVFVSIMPLQLLRESYLVFPESTTTDDNALHSEKIAL